MEAVIGMQTAMLITREVICEQIYREREKWNPDHPNRALGTRDISLDDLFFMMMTMRVEKQPDDMTKDELRAYASNLLDATLRRKEDVKQKIEL